MTYLLTVYLLVAGQIIAGHGVLPADSDCAASAAAVAAENGAQLVAWSCVLEMEV